MFFSAIAMPTEGMPEGRASSGMLWARYLLSPYPHARLRSIDVHDALSSPGVHAVLTGADIGPVRTGRALMDWPALAYDEWSPTCDTLHAHTQVLGKLAAALAPPAGRSRLGFSPPH